MVGSQKNLERQETMAGALERGIFLEKFYRACGQTTFIAEVKTESKLSGWQSPKSWEYLLAVATCYGHWVSIHTDQRWGGSFGKVAQARKFIEKLDSTIRPAIFAKGIHRTDSEVERAFDAGADYVLVVGRIPGVDPPKRGKYLIEPSKLQDLFYMPRGFKVVWNTRDLQRALLAYERGEKLPHDIERPETFSEARAIWPGWLCQASNIKTVVDVKKGADAILVGTHLETFIESIQSSRPTR